ncbi:MAG: MurT ligase domain-containing protein [Actinomycetota bacterium]|nr:MurT ligase domain-containing protein [Actinomycetota bacterium]
MTLRLSWRARLAVTSLVVVNTTSRWLGRGSGTVAGGRVGLAIEPKLLSELARARTVVLVTGTNGKTTTSAMLRQGWGSDVGGNVTGANMPAGHVAALCTSRGPRVVLETDEAWLAAVVEATTPAVVVLLNLSRDQLDRANEVRQMAQRWRDCLTPQRFSGVVVANAADPLVVFAAEGSTHVRWVHVPLAWRADASSCPHCTRAITFGDDHWSCECGFSQPTDLVARLSEVLEIAGGSYPLDLALPGEFNEINAALAATALVELGEDVELVLGRIRTLHSVQGRYGRRRYGNRDVRLLLAKNPAGTAALFDSIDVDSEVWVAINAQVADGKDPSWLYDVPFEVLRGRRIACLGERRLDLATRLLYGSVDCDVIDDPDVLRRATTPVTLVANYTAFRDWMARTSPC